MDYRASLAQQQQAYVKTTGFYGWLRQHRRLWLWLTFISVALVIELPFLLRQIARNNLNEFSDVD